MTFDPSITMGALLNALVLLIGFVIAFTRIGGRIDLLAQRLGSVEEVIKAASAISDRITSVEERINTAQRDISDLRHGEGFITSHRRSIDGQYP